MYESNDTALLAPESSRREKTAPQEPPGPIQEFRLWAPSRLPNWVKGKAAKVWKDPDDRRALDEIFAVRALFEIQACWHLFVRAGTRNYDYASKQRFSMREFRRQIEFLVGDPDYPSLKRRFLDEQPQPGISAIGDPVQPRTTNAYTKPSLEAVT